MISDYFTNCVLFSCHHPKREEESNFWKAFNLSRPLSSTLYKHFFLCETVTYFFNVGPSKENISFDHHLWHVLQSSTHILQITIFHMLDLCGQLPCTASTPVFLTCGFSSCLYFLFQCVLESHMFHFKTCNLYWNTNTV